MVTALVPLRGGSKSIPYKNIKDFAGKPLCAWVLEAVCAAASIEKVYVSTESDKIKEVVLGLGLDIEVLDRPNELAADETSTEEVLIHFARQVNAEVICTAQATSPLVAASDIDRAIEIFTRGGYDSLLTAVRLKRFFWTDDCIPINYDPVARPRRQDFKGTLMENGAFYLTKRDTLFRTGSRWGGKTAIYEMSPETAVEIDEPHDWQEAETLLLGREKV